MTEETVIVTGGNGFVGKYLVEELKREAPGTRVVVWDRSVEGLSDGVEGVEIDVVQPESYRESLQREQPVWVVHLAAVPSAALASQNGELAREVNVEGTRNLFREVERLSPGTRVMAVSSADIYGSTGLTTGGQGASTPLSELPLEEARPRNLYAQTKWEMERVIEEHFADMAIRVRPFPHIGPGQALGYVTADFASQVAAIESGRQKPILRVGNLEAKRDFTDVRDVVRAYRLLMEKGVYGEACSAAERERGVCGVYHVASGKAVSIQDVLDRLLALSEADVKVEQDPKLMRPSDVPVLVGDAAKLKQATGWQPTISLDTSLKGILDYWREKIPVTSNQ